MHVVVDPESIDGIVEVCWEFERNDELIELLFLADAIKRQGGHICSLKIPYIPFGRQDRAAYPGDCFSLKVFCDLINSIGAFEVIVTDPHSDVTAALLNNIKIIHQAEVFSKYFKPQDAALLISPDGGALKKIYKLAERVKSEVIECSKNRNVHTGEIAGVTAHADNLHGKACYIVDDICDGGRTFIEIAKVLKSKNAGKVVLMVTHGFFTKGLSVFDGLIDEIYTRKGKVK